MEKTFELTKVRLEVGAAQAAAEELCKKLINVPVDTVLVVERMQLVASFLAGWLAESGVNAWQNVAVVMPEVYDGRMLLESACLKYVMNSHVLIVCSGEQDIDKWLESVVYYGGTTVGVVVFEGRKKNSPVPVFPIIEK